MLQLKSGNKQGLSKERSFVYSPALKFKLGESLAVTQLGEDVKDKIAIRFIVPPPSEKDIETKRLLSVDEIPSMMGKRLGQYWPIRPFFLDPQHFLKAATDKGGILLPQLLSIARYHNAYPIAMATLDDLNGSRIEGFKSSLAQDLGVKVALRVQSGEMDSELKNKVDSALNRLGVVPQECVLFLDFADADLSDANLVAEFILNAQQAAIESGQWRNMVYQGTNYPEKNPAAAGDSAFVSRTEWSAWRNIPHANRIALYGDYGADSAKVDFKAGGGGFIIPHYRYCTMDGRWMVVRGKEGMPQRKAIKEVSGKIAQSVIFAGRDASIADRYIADTSLGLTEGGSATTWRQMNTIRHITQVVSDLGEIYDYQIRKLAIQKSEQQFELL